MLCSSQQRSSTLEIVVWSMLRQNDPTNKAQSRSPPGPPNTQRPTPIGILPDLPVPCVCFKKQVQHRFNIIFTATSHTRLITCDLLHLRLAEFEPASLILDGSNCGPGLRRSAAEWWCGMAGEGKLCMFHGVCCCLFAASVAHPKWLQL